MLHFRTAAKDKPTLIKAGSSFEVVHPARVESTGSRSLKTVKTVCSNFWFLVLPVAAENLAACGSAIPMCFCKLV